MSPAALAPCERLCPYCIKMMVKSPPTGHVLMSDQSSSDRASDAEGGGKSFTTHPRRVHFVKTVLFFFAAALLLVAHADQPTPRTDKNSQLAHEQLLAKAKSG